MTREETITVLKQELSYLGGGPSPNIHEYEEALSVAISTLKRLDETDINVGSKWISVKDRLPEPDVSVLVIANGKPHENITLDGAYELAEYGADGWILEMWPEWMDAKVTHWMPLPEPPKEEA